MDDLFILLAILFGVFLAMIVSAGLLKIGQLFRQVINNLRSK